MINSTPLQSATNCFYQGSETGPFVIGSETVCGECKKIIPDKDISSYQKYENSLLSEKFLRFVVASHKLEKSPIEFSAPACFWKGGIFHYSGYSTMNRNFIKHLVKFGINIKLLSYIPSLDISEKEAIWFGTNLNNNIPKNSPTVWGRVFSGPSPGKVIQFVMTEFEGLNCKFLQNLSFDDEIWVPTEWDKNKFLSYMVESPIHVIPLGVDKDLYKPSIGEIVYTSGVNDFIFLCVSSWNWRKGYDVLIKSYLRAFSSKDNVSLILLTREGESKENTENALLRIMLDIKPQNPAHIVLCKSIVPEEAMPFIYSHSQVFALLSRGEGWGLPYCEAAACGVPIVGALHGGQATFLREEDSFLVKPDKTVDVDPSMFWTDLYEGSRFVDYSDTVIDEAASKMRYVYEHYDEAKRKAEICRNRITSEFTWDNAAKKMYNRLIELQP